MKHPTKLALAAIAAVCWTLPLHAIYEVSDSGLWPTYWPKELDALRKQARTLAHDQFVVYEIPFTDRQQFEAAWPHLLAVKSPEAPLTLLKSPDQWLGGNLKAGVRIRAPLTGMLISPQGSRYPPSAEGVVTNVPLLKIGPPWPDNVLSKSGALPEFVVYDHGRWVPYSVQDLKTNAPMYERSLMRARIEIELIVSGDIVDLNRIPLPADTPIVDKRF